MTRPLSEVGLPDLEGFVNVAINLCRIALESGDTRRARLRVSSAAHFCQSTLADPDAELDDVGQHTVLLLGILCAAYRDFCDCVELLRNHDPPHDDIELSWIRLIDSSERVKAVDGTLGGPVVDWLNVQLGIIHQHFLNRLGPGSYLSPEIVTGRILCSICNRDYRACNHRAGAMYDGLRCKKRPDGVDYIRAVAIVDVPVDRRCRLWPWNVDEVKRQATGVVVLTSFDADDLTDPRERTADASASDGTEESASQQAG